MQNKKCILCEGKTDYSVTFYGRTLCKDCIEDVKAFEIDFDCLDELKNSENELSADQKMTHLHD